jgi:hypothetical protein
MANWNVWLICHILKLIRLLEMKHGKNKWNIYPNKKEIVWMKTHS